MKDVKIAFGLRAQGYLLTIEQMLKEGKNWKEIGAAIGWCPITAERFYMMEKPTKKGG
jgi:hypothetical protein